MPLSLPSLNLAIICDGYELEMHDAKQDGPNSIRAYVASEVGKVIVFLGFPGEHEMTKLS